MATVRLKCTQQCWAGRPNWEHWTEYASDTAHYFSDAKIKGLRLLRGKVALLFW